MNNITLEKAAQITANWKVISSVNSDMEDFYLVVKTAMCQLFNLKDIDDIDSFSEMIIEEEKELLKITGQQLLSTSNSGIKI